MWCFSCKSCSRSTRGLLPPPRASPPPPPSAAWMCVFVFTDTNSFSLLLAAERRPAGKARLWGADAGGSLQAAAGLQQQRAGPQRLQEPAHLQRQDRGLPGTAAEEERGAAHGRSRQEVTSRGRTMLTSLRDAIAPFGDVQERSEAGDCQLWHQTFVVYCAFCCWLRDPVSAERLACGATIAISGEHTPLLWF